MASPDGAHQPTRIGNLDIIAGAFCALLILSNICAVKPIQIWVFVLDGGAFLFPLTYIFGDVLAEVYGFRRARRVIYLGFAMEVVATLAFWLVIAVKPVSGWTGQASFVETLGYSRRIALASLCGYIIGQLLNAQVVVRIKRLTGEKSLWSRLVGSTVVGELADTSVFCTVAFLGTLSSGQFVNYIIVGYVYKCLVEVVFLPVTYRVIAYLKRREPDYVPALSRAERRAAGVE